MLQRLGKFVFISSFFIVLNLNIASCRNSGSIVKPTPPPNPSATPENPVARRLEDIYAPVLLFDSKEKNPIGSIDNYIQLGVSLQGKKGLGKFKVLKEKITLEELEKYPNPKLTVDNDDLELMLQTKNQVNKYDETIYSRKMLSNNYTYLQYWFFYSYNDTSGIGGNSIIQKCGNHQADWEHIAVKLNNEKLKKSTTDKDYLTAIEEFYFSQHNKGQHDERKFKKPNDKEVTFEGITHVKAYPARGTHATYFQPHKDNGYPLAKILTTQLYDKADGKGQLFKTEGHVKELESFSWSKYGGKWGQISDDVCNIAEWFSDASNDGPIGPLQQSQKNDWDK